MDRQGARAAAAAWAFVLVASVAYLSFVFRLLDDVSWRHGLGDWQDPYFINALLEHWYRSVLTLSSPASPPMYFPATGTLGYSHGLMLFAPFYIPLRLFLHPFHAHTLALLAVMVTGALCLFAWFRRVALTPLESLVLAALFVSSRNVVHGETGVWSQRASVFLVPPILLLLVVARRGTGTRRTALAALGGGLAMLLYVQDFYTAHFTMLFAGLAAVAIALVEPQPLTYVKAFWQAQTRTGRWLCVTAVLLAAWAAFVWLSGGAEFRFAGVRLRSHDWHRPLAAAVLIGFASLGWSARAGRLPRIAHAAWWLALAGGAVAGAAVFLAIYLPTYQEHPAFPREHLLSALLSPRLQTYSSMRTFLVVAFAALLAWMPGAVTEMRTRIYCTWLLAVSAIVALVPIAFPGFSAWMAFVHWLPGFAVVRDPKRIIQVYELAAVVALALLLPRFARRFRLVIVGTAVCMLVVFPNPERFDFERRVDVFDRWVGAPMSIDPSCRSFYITRATPEYMARSTQMWSLYGVDATFIALDRGVPSLNGYSAWFPDGWALHDPQLPGYEAKVRAWIDRAHLAGVCALDMTTRQMVPIPGSR